MDPQKLVEILQGTIHPELREAAEKQLDEVSTFRPIIFETHVWHVQFEWEWMELNMILQYACMRNNCACKIKILMNEWINETRWEETAELSARV